MKKRLVLALTISMIVILITASLAVAAPAAKRDVCHFDKDAGIYFLISISENAFQAHVDHGDGGIGDPIPTMPGYIFGDDCQEVAYQTAYFYKVPSGSSDVVSDELAGGKVNIITPTDNVALIIQGNVVGLTASTTYDAWVRQLFGYTGPSIFSVPGMGYYKLVSFTTDEFGNASFHINLLSNDLPGGTYNIQVAINQNSTGSPSYIGTTIIATQKYTTVIVN